LTLSDHEFDLVREETAGFRLASAGSSISPLRSRKFQAIRVVSCSSSEQLPSRNHVDMSFSSGV